MNPLAQTPAAAETMPLPFPVRLTSHRSKRGVLASSLRPGDFIRLVEDGVMMSVVQNSGKLRKIELRYPSGFCVVHGYDSLLPYCEYVGAGKLRAWRKWLPRWIRKFINPWRAP